MTPEERAHALVGDMPWVVMRLTSRQSADLPKQIAAAIRAAEAEAREQGRREEHERWLKLKNVCETYDYDEMRQLLNRALAIIRTKTQTEETDALFDECCRKGYAD